MTLLNKFVVSVAMLFTLGAHADEFGIGDAGPDFYPGQRVSVNCNSSGFSYNTCYVGPGIRNAYLIRQISRSQCVQGQTWGYTYDSIWVDQGCRGDFEVELSGGGPGGPGHGGPGGPGHGGPGGPGHGGPGGPGHGGPGGPGHGGPGGPGHGGGYYSEDLNCSSSGYAFASCYPQTRAPIYQVQLISQLSRSACIEGRTWGWDSSRVWVDQGCRANFRVFFR